MSTIDEKIRQFTEDTWDLSGKIILDEIIGQCNPEQAIGRRKAYLERVQAFLDTEQPVFPKLYGVSLSDSCCEMGFFLARDQAKVFAVEGYRLGFAILERIDPSQMDDDEKASYLLEAVAGCSNGAFRIEDEGVFIAICHAALDCPVAHTGAITEEIEKLAKKASEEMAVSSESQIQKAISRSSEHGYSGNVPPAIAMDTPVPLDDAGLYKGMHDALGVHDRRLVAADIDQVTELNLSGYGIRWIDNLQALPILRSLNLSNNNIRDISPLACLAQLESLSLQGNRLADVSPLCRLACLASLDLGDNAVYDVKPLAKLAGLRHLDLRHNHLRMTNDLRHLTHLEWLDLSGNPVMEYSGLLSMASLKFVRINDEPINEWVLNQLYDRGVQVEIVSGT